MKEELLKEFNHALEKENNLLLICILVLMLIFVIWFGIAFKERNDLEKENIQLRQQVIDYKWQLEQVKYIIDCNEKGD